MEQTESLRVNIAYGEDAIHKLKEDWLDLLSNISTPSLEQDWRWNAILAQQVFKSSFVILSVHIGTKPIAIFPLQIKTIKRCNIQFRSLSNLSDEKLLDLSDALIHPGWLTKPILQSIKHFLKSTDFALIEFSDFTSRSLLSKLSTMGWLCEPARSQNAYIICTDMDSLKTLSKKHLKNIERLSSKAEAELGTISLDIIIGNDIQPSDLDDLIAIEHSGWKAASGSSILASNTRLFYEMAIQDLAETKDSYLIFLKTGNIRTACAMAFKAGEALYLHKIAYQDEVKEFGPGNIMLLNLLRVMATSSEINEVNLVTCPDWSERWHLSIASRLSLRCFNSNIKGILFLFLLKIKKMGQAFKTKLTKKDL